MYELFSKAVETTSNIMYSYLLIILLLAVGLYFTFRTRFVQFRLLGESVRLVTEKSSGENSVSAFQALMVSTCTDSRNAAVYFQSLKRRKIRLRILRCFSVQPK